MTITALTLHSTTEKSNIKDITVTALFHRTGCRISVKPKLSQAPTILNLYKF